MSCRKIDNKRLHQKACLILFQSVYINEYSFKNDLPSDGISKELESLAKYCISLSYLAN